MYCIIDFILTFLENREEKRFQKREAKLRKKRRKYRPMKSRYKDSIIA